VGDLKRGGRGGGREGDGKMGVRMGEVGRGFVLYLR